VTWFILVSALITLSFYHPLLIFAFLYSIIFFSIRNEVFISKKHLYLISVTFFLGVLIKTIVFRTPYEKNSLSGLKNFITLFPDFFTLFSNKQFFMNCLFKYYWIPILFTGTIGLYCTKRQWANLLLFLSFFIAYLLLINVTFPTDVTPLFYIESLYLPLSIFLALPFVFYILPVLEKKRLALPVMVLIIVSGCVRVYAAHDKYTARLDLERTYLDKYGGEKVVIKATKKDKDVLQMLWGTPYEFLLLSVSEHGKPASIIIDDHPEKLVGLTTLKNGLRVNWETYPYSSLPTKYFNFTDTTSGYIINP